MYCSNCGNKSESKANFCANCGTKLVAQVKSNSLQEFDEVKFTSNILLGGAILTPDKILLGATGVSYIKRNKFLIGEDIITISYKKISSVEIDRGIIDADILVKGFGGETILVKDFSIGNAKKIKEIIESRI